MSLDYKPLGNPKWGKGMPSANPMGRPKGPPKKTLDVKRRLLNKWQTHPVDKLVKIANFIEPTNPELAGKIWMRLLDSCELEERKKKDTLPPIEKGEETPSDLENLKLLEELENGTVKDLPKMPESPTNNGISEGQTI